MNDTFENLDESKPNSTAKKMIHNLDPKILLKDHQKVFKLKKWKTKGKFIISLISETIKKQQ